jgi:hypothetical protein
MAKRCMVRNRPAENRVRRAIPDDDRGWHHIINAGAARFGFTEIAAGIYI